MTVDPVAGKLKGRSRVVTSDLASVTASLKRMRRPGGTRFLAELWHRAANDFANGETNLAGTHSLREDSGNAAHEILMD